MKQQLLFDGPTPSTADVRVVAGPARSGKTSRLFAEYRRRLGEGAIGAALWLCPTHRSAAAASDRLVDRDLPGCLAPNLLTFDQFASRVLAAAAPAMRPLSALQARILIQRLIAEQARAGRLTYFAPIASTTGLLDLVVELIRELKQLEIWPEEFAAASRAGSKDRELAELYSSYQQLLLSHELYDAEGRFWAARALIREGAWGPFAAVRHVFVDGFTDFTRTEHDVLQLLAERVESVTISLMLENDTRRGDLFARSLATLEALRRRHPRLRVEHLPRRPLVPPALDYLERCLFAPPREAAEGASIEGLEVVRAAGVTHEIELLAERVKTLLTGGAAGEGPVAPGDVLVVFRTLAEVAPLVREVFCRYGIPCATSAAPPLAAAPIVQALLAWLRLDVEDWPFSRVLGVLSHNYFQPSWRSWQHGRAAVALEHLTRELELPSGRAELVRSVERLAERGAAAAHAKRRLAARLRFAQLAAPLLGDMCRALDALPRQATPDAWAGALAEMCAELGLFAAARGGPLGDAAAAADAAAWQRLTQALVEVGRLARWQGAAAPRWTRTELLAELEAVVRVESLPAAHDEAGRVRVLSAEGARNLSAPYVFLASLEEKSFPPAHRDTCTYSDAERRQLAEAGLPLTSHEGDSRYEMLLFYEMATRATRRLVLSYPALDAMAQPMTPSPYLDELRRAFAGRLSCGAPPRLNPVPPDDAVASWRDLRVRAVARALAGDPALLAGLSARGETRDMADNVLAALATTAARRSGPSFGPFEGVLAAPAAAAALAARFGPEHCWSPSQLERYAYCPFQFFVQQVLRAEPLGEGVLAIDHLERGRMLHWLLSSAHRKLNALAGGPTSPGDHELGRFLEVVGELVGELRGGGGERSLAGGLLEIDVRKILAWIDAYHGQHARYDLQWHEWGSPPRPAHFEVAFGRAVEVDEGEGTAVETVDGLSTSEPFELDCGGEPIRFSGRIDRIDLGELAGQRVYSIVDYKSGQGSKRTALSAVLEGMALQLPLYTLAAGWLLGQRAATPLRAAYWHVGGHGYDERQAVKLGAAGADGVKLDPDWIELAEQVRLRVGALVAGIRRGEFPMHCADDKCTTFCSYRTVCRVNQVRSLEKTWPAPATGDEDHS